MSYRNNTDNIYKEGTVITAKVNPGVKLFIANYYQRLYYCTIIGDAEKKQQVYFERELVPPVPGD